MHIASKLIACHDDASVRNRQNPQLPFFPSWQHRNPSVHASAEEPSCPCPRDHARTTQPLAQGLRGPRVHGLGTSFLLRPSQTDRQDSLAPDDQVHGQTAGLGPCLLRTPPPPPPPPPPQRRQVAPAAQGFPRPWGMKAPREAIVKKTLHKTTQVHHPPISSLRRWHRQGEIRTALSSRREQGANKKRATDSPWFTGCDASPPAVATSRGCASALATSDVLLAASWCSAEHDTKFSLYTSLQQ